MSMLDASGKVELLRSYLRGFGLRTMVETGVYQGHCSGLGLLDELDTLIVIDYQFENCRRVSEAAAKVLAICDDSAAAFADLATMGLPGPVLFWLDAHAIDAAEGAPPCPLSAELDAVARWEYGASSVILIDDLRMMQPDSSYVRELGWPTLDELRRQADATGFWDREEGDDIMRLTPRGKGAAMPRMRKPDEDEKPDAGEKDDGDGKEPECSEQAENPELYEEMRQRGLR